MEANEIDELHKAYRAALSRYTEARTIIETLGKTFSDLGSQLSGPARRVRVWNIFCAGVGNDLTTDDRSLSERKNYTDALNPQGVETALNGWRNAMSVLKDTHKKLSQLGEADNAAPLPNDIKNT